LERVLDQAQLNGPEGKFPAAVRVKHGVNRSGKTLHYFFNFSAGPQRVSNPYQAGVELLSGRTVTAGGEISLDPWGVAIVEE
jgi:beta-galactosidase